MAKNKDMIIKEHMAEIGRKGGNANKRKGKAFFQYVRSHNKVRPVRTDKKESNE